MPPAERGQHALGAQPSDEDAGVLGDLQRIGAEAPRRADDHRVGRVVADVDHRRQIPVDPGGPQHRADPARLQLGHDEVVRLAELLRRERRRPPELGPQTHDVAALGIHGDEELSARARRELRRERAGQPDQLIGVDDVAAEKENAADAAVAEEPREIRVAGRLGAAKAHQEERAELALERLEARAVRRPRGPAAGGEKDAEEVSGGEPPQRASRRACARPPAGRRRFV